MVQVAGIWDRLYRAISASPSSPRQPIQIRPDHVRPSRPPPRDPAPAGDTVVRPGTARSGDAIEAQEDYVSIFLNQLFLANSRKWFTQIEPTVFASTEFLYAGTMRTDPVVIGPRPNESLPRGMVLKNTPVFGPHPYRGGPLTFTFVLSQLPVGDVARSVLEVVEATSGALAPTLSLDLYTKMGGIVLDGFTKLMGLNAIQPLIGLRDTMSPDGFKPLHAGRWALIDMNAPDPDEFWVADDILLHGSTEATARPFQSADFLLFQIARSPDAQRKDIDALPINAMWLAALEAASKGSDAAWAEAKSNFAAMISAISTSHDLLWKHGQDLIDERLSRLIAVREQTVKLARAPDQEDPRAGVRQRISNVLSLP
ncbi:MAG TPA: hypothetical protein VIQ53_21555 [Inquilinus sp.]